MCRAARGSWGIVHLWSMVCDALNAPQHTAWIFGREVFLDPLSVCSLGLFDFGNQLFPRHSECHSVTKPERNIPGFQQRLNLCIQPWFLVRIVFYSPGAGDILHTSHHTRHTASLCVRNNYFNDKKTILILE